MLKTAVPSCVTTEYRLKAFGSFSDNQELNVDRINVKGKTFQSNQNAIIFQFEFNVKVSDKTRVNERFSMKNFKAEKGFTATVAWITEQHTFCYLTYLCPLDL